MLSVLWQNFDIANGQILKNTTTQSCAFPFALEHTGSKERGSVHFLQIWHKSGKVTEALNTFAAAPWALKKHYHRKVVFVHLKSSGILSLECTVFCSTFWGVDIYAIKLFFALKLQLAVHQDEDNTKERKKGKEGERERRKERERETLT